MRKSMSPHPGVVTGVVGNVDMPQFSLAGKNGGAPILFLQIHMEGVQVDENTIAAHAVDKPQNVGGGSEIIGFEPVDRFHDNLTVHGFCIVRQLLHGLYHSGIHLSEALLWADNAPHRTDNDGALQLRAQVELLFQTLDGPTAYRAVGAGDAQSLHTIGHACADGGDGKPNFLTVVKQLRTIQIPGIPDMNLHAVKAVLGQPIGGGAVVVGKNGERRVGRCAQGAGRSYF